MSVMHRICPHCGFDLVRDAPVEIGRMIIEPGTLWIDGNRVKMTGWIPHLILHSLAKAGGRTLSKDVLMARIDSDAIDHVLLVYISRLRSYLAPHGLDGIIVTDWGKGWHFDTRHPALEALADA